MLHHRSIIEPYAGIHGDVCDRKVYDAVEELNTELLRRLFCFLAAFSGFFSRQLQGRWVGFILFQMTLICLMTNTLSRQANYYLGSHMAVPSYSIQLR
jgi:hypothetical protein